MAQRGLEPATAIDLVKSYAIRARRLRRSTPKKLPLLELKISRMKNSRSHIITAPVSNCLYLCRSRRKDVTWVSFFWGSMNRATYPPKNSSLLSSIGKQVGVAMENAHLYEQAEQTAITAERNRLARELHDAVTQTLFSANLIADVIPRIWKRNPEEGLQNLEELRQLTRGALAEMRTMLLEMRPESLERADIKSLLTQLADAFIGRVRVPVSLVIQGDCELTHEVKIVFYRVAQEALNNIAKHSGARQVERSFGMPARSNEPVHQRRWAWF